METLIYLAPLAGLVSLLFAGFFASSVLKEGTGSKEMTEIAGAIQEGAMAYLNRQYKTIAFVAIIIIAVVILALFLIPGLGMRRFFFAGFPRGNFTLDENQINEVSGVFENAETSEDITEYCNEHRMECGYYCRNVNPEHKYCINLSDLRNRGGV